MLVSGRASVCFYAAAGAKSCLVKLGLFRCSICDFVHRGFSEYHPVIGFVNSLAPKAIWLWLLGKTWDDSSTKSWTCYVQRSLWTSEQWNKNWMLSVVLVHIRDYTTQLCGGYKRPDPSEPPSLMESRCFFLCLKCLYRNPRTLFPWPSCPQWLKVMEVVVKNMIVKCRCFKKGGFGDEDLSISSCVCSTVNCRSCTHRSLA